MSHDGKPVIGEHNLGENARKQLEEARRDPRLDRRRGASVADFWAAVEEAERVRMLGIWGLYELQRSLENEEAKLGVSRNDPNLDDSVTRRLQAAWERAELARSDHEAGHSGLNAQCLVSQVSALDALVEEFAPAMREIQIAMIADQMTKKAAEEHPEAAAALSLEVHTKIGEVVRKQLADILPRLKSLKNKGAQRYEKLLAGVGLAAPADRQIPQDLDQAIAEMGALRDVLVHRSARIDAKALVDAPSLRWAEGELVRLSDDDYRKYSAAVRCYSEEIVFRSIRAWPEVTDKDGPNLANWKNYYRLGA